MKLNITLIVAAFAAFVAALPAPAVTPSAAKLEVRSPTPGTGTEQKVGESSKEAKSIEAKCWGNCGGVVPSVVAMRWDHQLAFGNPSFSTFSQFSRTFNDFVTISRNSIGFWRSQNLQAQQFAWQFQQMISNFWQMLTQFQRGCILCRGVSQTFQFQNIVSSFFISIQQVLVIIQRQYWNQINLFQYDLRILSSCIQVIFGITQTLGLPMNIIFNKINMNLFVQMGIPIAQFQYYNQQSLFNSIGNVSPYGYNNGFNNGYNNGFNNGFNNGSQNPGINGITGAGNSFANNNNGWGNI